MANIRQEGQSWNPYDLVTTEELTAEKMLCHVMRDVTEKVHRFESKVDAKFFEMLHLEAKRSVLELSTLIASNRMERTQATISVEYPLTWWDHLKKDLSPMLPKWLNKRLEPPNMATRSKTVDVLSVYVTCPHINCDTPDRDGKYLHFAWLNQKMGPRQ